MNDGPEKFIIIAQPRTGSTLVCSLLSSHPSIRAVIEPINPRGHSHHMQPNGHRLLPQYLIHNHINEALDILFSKEPIPNAWNISQKKAEKAAGFKIMIHQIRALRNENHFWNYILNKRVKVICVFRQNIMMQYLSDLIVQKTLQPACYDGNIITAKVEVPIDTLGVKLESIINERRYLLEKLIGLNLHSHRLNYEMFKDDTSPIMRVAEWLISDHYKLTTKLCKQNPDSLRQRVLNYNDVVKELKKLQVPNSYIGN